MADFNVGNKAVGNKATASTGGNEALTSMLEALKSGDLETAMGAMQNLLNARGAKVQGDKSKPGFADKLKAGLEAVKGSLSSEEAAACEGTLKAASAESSSGAASTASTPSTTPESTEQKQVDPTAMSSARRHAQTAERARQAALLTRVDVENAGKYVGTWNPQMAQRAITDLDGRQSLLEGERENVGKAMTELGGEIKTLEGKTNRSEAESVNLEAKKGQLQSFQMLDQALSGRIDQMKAAKGALKFDNFNNETGKNEISRDEAIEIVNHGNIVDKETVAASEIGRKSDALAIKAEDLAQSEAAPAQKPVTTKPAGTNNAAATNAAATNAAATNAAATNAAATNASVTDVDGGSGTAATTANANATANPTATANATVTANGANGANATAAKAAVSVKEGQWLSRICANSKNADGSRVTLDQLRAQPENKYIFDRAASGDVVKVGDKVTLPAGATFDGQAVKTDAKTDAKNASGAKNANATNASKAANGANASAANVSSSSAPKTGPRKGLQKPDANAVNANAANTGATNASTANASTAKADAGATNAGATTFAKLSDKQVNDAVAAVAAGVGGTKGQMTDVNKVFDAVSGMSPNQVQQVKDSYNAKFGAQGWDFDKNVTGAMYPWNQRAMQALEKGDQKGFEAGRAEGKKLDAQVKGDATTLANAVNGAGTDENAIFGVLKKNVNNPDMRAALEKEYARNNGGESLRKRLDDELGSVDFADARNGADDVSRARALLNGDGNGASAALLHSLLADGSRNPDVALQVMSKEIPAANRKGVADAFRKAYGVSVEDMVQAQSFVGTDQKARMLRAAKDMG